MNHFPSLLAGLHLEPAPGIEISGGVHYGRVSVANDPEPIRWRLEPLVGVGFNLDLLRTLLGRSVES